MIQLVDSNIENPKEKNDNLEKKDSLSQIEELFSRHKISLAATNNFNSAKQNFYFSNRSYSQFYAPPPIKPPIIIA